MQRGANSACRKSCTQNLHAMARGMHVALADGPARPVTIRYVMNTYDIAVISICSIYLVRHSVLQHCAGQGLAGRPVRIRSLHVYVCELVYKLISI